MIPVPGGYDFALEGGKIPTVEKGVQAAQKFGQKLLTYRGENSLTAEDDEVVQITNKEDDGTRWYEVLFDVSKSRAEKDLEIKRRLLTTEGVKKILKPLEWVQEGHQVNITGSILSDWGEEIELGGLYG
jgi:hypothetical protein